MNHKRKTTKTKTIEIDGESIPATFMKRHRMQWKLPAKHPGKGPHHPTTWKTST